MVTNNILQADILEKLKTMHKKITSGNSSFAKRIECIYIPIKSLKNYEKENAYFPCLHVGGDFYTDGFGLLEKHILREKGIILKGPDPKTFIRPVFPNELKKATLDSLREWWFPKLTDHSKLQEDDYQVYAILTMCRAFYTVQFGDIASKSKAAEYAKKTLESKWASLINEALAWKNGKNFHKLEETLNFLEYTLKKLNI